MEIYHQYVRVRRHFGRHAKFADGGAEMLADIRPNGEHAAAVVTKNPVTTATQCVPEVSEHDANTTAVVYASKAMSHMEGGWPKDVDPAEAEHTIRWGGLWKGAHAGTDLHACTHAAIQACKQEAPPMQASVTATPRPTPHVPTPPTHPPTHPQRYRKKVEKDEEFIRTLAGLGAAVEGLLKQNNAVDIYEDYFAGLAADHSAEPPSAATVTAFRDPRGAFSGAPRRAANCVSWHPDGAAKVVIAYSNLGFQRQPAGVALGSYVFDVSSPNAPESELLGLSQLVSARYNLKDANLIGAGQYNGQFSVFDTRKGAAPVETTPIDASHRWEGRVGPGPGVGDECQTCMQQKPNIKLV
jgi:hypothetical protein